MVKGIEESDPESFAKLIHRGAYQAPGSTVTGAAAAAAASDEAMPWRAFLRNTPVRALAYTHFCNNWCGPHFGEN